MQRTKVCEEFRPISTVPSYEIDLELLQYFYDCNNVLHHNQSVFRRDGLHETVTADICPKWLQEMHKENVVTAVLLEFRKAFETIDRKLLLYY